VPGRRTIIASTTPGRQSAVGLGGVMMAQRHGQGIMGILAQVAVDLQQIRVMC
jgi:hypothetical protein